MNSVIEISYETLAALSVPGLKIYWAQHGSGAYDAWAGTDRFFFHCSVTGENIALFEANIKDPLNVVQSEGDARTLAAAPFAVLETIVAAQTLSDTSPVIVTKSILTGRKSDGSYINAEFSSSGHPIVDATQSGTWNLTNISGTISLPTGAATSAKQPNFGPAGTPSADVLSIQGVTSMTPLKVDGSGFTQPVSGTVAATQSGAWNITNITGSISLPTGAATESTLGGVLTTTAFQARINTLGQKTMANSTPITIASDQTALPISGTISIASAITANQGTPAANANAWPTQIYDPKVDKTLDVTLVGAMEVAHTLRLTGSNHTDSTLDTNEWTSSVGGSGTTTVSSGVLDLGTGATSNSSAIVTSVYSATFTPAQSNNFAGGFRVDDTGATNNTRRWGAFDTNNGVFFQLSGTTFSVVVRSAGSDTVINSGSFNGAVSSYTLDTNFHLYEIQYTGSQAFFMIDRVLIHRYSISTSTLCSNLTLYIRQENVNSGGGTSNVHLYGRTTSISRLGALETVRVAQSLTDVTQVALTRSIITGRKSDGSYVNAAFDDSGRLIVAPSGATAITRGFVFGALPYSTSAQARVEATTYVEQSSNAQRSLVSTSANDTSAGTGARTVKITYLKSDGSGPFTDTVTMNGTSAVNTTATDICFIEKMEVVTVGSNGTNVGTINIKTTTGGGGSTFGSIGVNTLATGGDGRTLWAHHYVPLGKTDHITSITTGHGLNTSTGSGGVFHLKSLPIGVSNAIEVQISDFVHQYGQASSTPRLYGTAIDIAGPARITAFVLPDAALTVVYLASFDYFEDAT